MALRVPRYMGEVPCDLSGSVGDSSGVPGAVEGVPENMMCIPGDTEGSLVDVAGVSGDMGRGTLDIWEESLGT